MTLLDDPASVAAQYAREDNLRARQALYEESEGVDAGALLRGVLARLAPRRALEVGGGPGELAAWMKDDFGAEVELVDISPRMVELARERGVCAREGDVQELPFPDGAFDVAVAAWMLYHVPDLDRGLSELARVLPRGGTLVAVTNSVDHLRELRELLCYPAELAEKFSRENGAEFLRRHFTRVERHDAEVTVTVRDRGKLVAYRDSMSVPVGPVPDDVPLPFIVHGKSSVFVATR